MQQMVVFQSPSQTKHTQEPIYQIKNYEHPRQQIIPAPCNKEFHF